ncbi:acetolactate synthase-1/2/3 large subunit [Paenibacillus sophorae]|uniref:Acetolactate synthase-1/2/3 large subunit n=1 Tax=Paenibacillus sophorae TaxID=1333845 RepID=A0A1H8KHS9_9BACL|nr:thiamine pyrophosphate-binding protein [Paenibacillus sophorae]QWU13748.1 thiamine pyrophosphate-binding protein [Paenibacillus sophorae]SEN92377.1 acetolactate synthase-1/2/3 large subunit [Paenibacillus sophorae]
MNITGAELVVQSLTQHHIDMVFGLVGNQISPILVHLEYSGIRYIGTRHEQAAIHMADGYSQVKRTSAVAMVSGGPGFTNSITGIVKAFFANTPLVVIIGSVVNSQRNKGALQDMDQLGMIRNYTKWSATVFEPSRIPEMLHQAFYKANSGKKGPVVLEIPIDVLKREIDVSSLSGIIGKCDVNCDVNASVASLTCIEDFVRQLDLAERPVILLGDETYYAKCEMMLEELLSFLNIPVFTIAKARGIVSDSDHDSCCGNGRILEAGPQTEIISQADLVVNIGVSSDYQMDFFGEPLFHREQRYINISEYIDDLPFLEFEKSTVWKVNVHAFLSALRVYLRDNQLKLEKAEWLAKARTEIDLFFDQLDKTVHPSEDVNPVHFLNTLQNKIMPDTILVLDGSNAMFWAGLLLRANTPGQIIIASDGTHGPMGPGLPLALGAKLAAPGREVLLYTGDGSFGFNMAELDTSIAYRIPVTVIVHNDRSWGLCKTTQEILYQSVCGVELSDVRYDRITEAFGGEGVLVERDVDVEDAINGMVFPTPVTRCLDVRMITTSYSPGLAKFNTFLEAMK